MERLRTEVIVGGILGGTTEDGVGVGVTLRIAVAGTTHLRLVVDSKWPYTLVNVSYPVVDVKPEEYMKVASSVYVLKDSLKVTQLPL